jgi:hypothetical protein
MRKQFGAIFAAGASAAGKQLATAALPNFSTLGGCMPAAVQLVGANPDDPNFAVSAPYTPLPHGDGLPRKQRTRLAGAQAEPVEPSDGQIPSNPAPRIQLRTATGTHRGALGHAAPFRMLAATSGIDDCFTASHLPPATTSRRHKNLAAGSAHGMSCRYAAATSSNKHSGGYSKR